MDRSIKIGRDDVKGQDNHTGTKRLFSNRSSTTILKSIENDEDDNEAVGSESPAGKRYRSDDWPLQPAEDSRHGGRRASLLGHSNGPDSPLSSGRTMSRGRASKFAEGSMNDRASRMPPDFYTGIKGAGDNISESLAAQVVDRNETSRHSTSSIFRFGKSLAASFNPSNWKIWSRQQDDLDAKDKVLKDRREQAEIAYKQLKRDGQIGNGISNSASSLRYSSTTQKYTSSHQPQPQFDESGGDALQEGMTPRQQKRYGKIFLDPPMLHHVDANESPNSDVQSLQQPNRILGLSTSSLRTMHRNDTQNSLPAETSGPEQTLRRLPSRKELQKQQKLVKRVSDLEGKLEAARRQLAEAIGEPMPLQMTRRSRFIPSILSTLPSESLLAAHASGHAIAQGIDTQSEIGQAISTNVPSPADFKSSAKNQESGVSKPDVKGVSTPVMDEKPLPSPPSLDEVKMQETVGATTEQPTGKEESVSMKNGTGVVGDLKIPKQRGKKRKSIGTGIADDGGRYKPSPFSDDDEDIELSRSSVTQGRGRTRKHIKMSHGTPPPKESTKKGLDANKDSTPGRAKLQKHNRQSRSQIGASSVALDSSRPRQMSERSISPPPRVSPLLDNDPAAQADVPGDKMTNDDFVLSTQVQIPPVPQLPSSVRLASGEIVKVGPQKTSKVDATSKSEEGDSEGDETKQVVGNADDTARLKSKKSFEWPEDIF